MSRWAKAGLLAVPYIAAVVAANLAVRHWGPAASPTIAFFAVSAVLIFRDRFSDIVGSRRTAQVLQVGLIAVGALLTYVINESAAQIAKASVIAFAASEGVEQVLYYLMRMRPWLERAPWSAVFGAVVDSFLFIAIAFGLAGNLWVVGAQIGCKIGGAWLWASVIEKLRSGEVRLGGVRKAGLGTGGQGLARSGTARHGR